MTPKQKKLLKQMNKLKKLRRSDFSSEELETLKFLMGQKYAEPRNTPDVHEQCYRITEDGKRAIHNTRQTDFRFWFPLVLSNMIAFAALIISVVALLKA